ncbi:MAG: hypothetical protein COB02_07205 [Candidatus Cloacimonadota bacterium]|nr:MAG: hypothetical protein COB02_07205 [Candidatus Cloacimonadota bacterium]
MGRMIALFRGVNVGGNNLLKMADLRTLLEGLGLKNVKTYIQSGNVVFDSDLDNLEELISTKVNDVYYFSPKILLLTNLDLQKCLDENPFKDRDVKSQHFFFLKAPPKDVDLSLLKSIQANDEEFKLTNKVFYLFTPNGIVDQN